MSSPTPGRILPPFVLAFDPAAETTEPFTREVFLSPVVTVIWLGLATTHGEMTDKHHFSGACLAVVRAMSERKSRKQPVTAHWLRFALRSYGLIARENKTEMAFCEELLPYVLGEKAMAYTVNLQGAG